MIVHKKLFIAGLAMVASVRIVAINLNTALQPQLSEVIQESTSDDKFVIATAALASVALPIAMHAAETVATEVVIPFAEHVAEVGLPIAEQVAESIVNTVVTQIEHHTGTTNMPDAAAAVIVAGVETAAQVAGTVATSTVHAAQTVASGVAHAAHDVGHGIAQLAHAVHHHKLTTEDHESVHHVAMDNALIADIAQAIEDGFTDELKELEEGATTDSLDVTDQELEAVIELLHDMISGESSSKNETNVHPEA